MQKQNPAISSRVSLVLKAPFYEPKSNPKYNYEKTSLIYFFQLKI